MFTTVWRRVLDTIKSYVRKLDVSYPQCLQTAILGITDKQQWGKYISSSDIRERWGDVDLISTKLIKRCFKWLGDFARMSNQQDFN